MNLESIKSIYFIGAGGIGMSALVRYFLSKGKFVAGYDRTKTELTETLTAEGAHLPYTEELEALPAGFKDPPETLLVFAPAIPQDHPELNVFPTPGF